MAKTYTLTSTACKGGMNSSWTSGQWGSYYFNNGGNTRRCGQVLSGGAYCAVYYMFDAASLRALQSKTIISVTLRITVDDGTGIPGGSSDLYAIRAKQDNTTGSNSSCSAWAGGSTILGYIRRASGSSSTFDIALSNSIPSYGYTMGPYAAGYGQFVELAATATLIVVTNENDYSYTLAFDANSGSGAPASQTGSNTGTSPSYTFTIPNTIPSRTGYTFLGWSTSSTATTATYAAGGQITVTSSGTTTLYAVWKINTWTVSFNANGGNNAPANQTKTYGVNLTLSSSQPTRTGYTFLRWDTKTDGTGTSFAPGSTYTANADLVLYAIWQLITYTVSFDANGGTLAPSSQSKLYNVTLTLTTATPTRDGYLFNGWATSASGPVAYQPGGSYTANAGITLYAVWEAANSTLSSVTSPVTIGVADGGTAAWNVINSAYTYELVLTCGNAPAVTVNVAANTASTTFTIPNTWLSYISSATSASATATLTTYSGTTSLGTSTVTFTVSVASSVKPTISSFTAAHYSSNATVSGWGEFTQGYSQADLSVSAAAGTGASITSIAFSGQGINQSGDSTTGRTAAFDSPGTYTYTVTVTDSRGRSTTATLSVVVYPYARPVIYGIETNRARSDGTIDNGSGTYLALCPSYSISSVHGQNSISSQTIMYREHGAVLWTASATCANGVTMKPPGTSWAATISKSYDIAVSVTDAIGNTTTLVVVLPGAAGVWLDPDNESVGLGAPPEGPGFYCTLDAYFKGGFAIGNTGLTEAQLQALKALIT